MATVPTATSEAAATETASSNLALLLALGLALLTLLTFLPALDHDFVNYDDPLYVTESPWATEGLSATNAAWVWSHFYAGHWHPLALLSHMLDVELFGLEPRGHHLTNVLLHTLGVVLLFGFLRRATGATWRSAACAALFAVHPLRVESVAWIAERKDVLSILFGIATLGAYLRFVERRTLGRYLLVALWFALSLLSKAMLVTLPFVLLLLDFWPLGRLAAVSVGGRRRAMVRCLVEKIPLLMLAIAAGVVAVFAQRPYITPAEAVPLGFRLANAVVSYGTHVLDFVAPHHLAVFYPYPTAIAAWKVMTASAVLAGITAAALVAWRRAPYLVVGWLWFLGVLAPVIGVLKFGSKAMADRYSYFPSIGLALALVWGLHALLGKRAPKTLALVLAAAIVLIAGLARVQLEVWASSETLFRHALAVTQNNWLAHLNLAEALRTTDRPREAEPHYRAALAIKPGEANAHAGLGETLRALGDAEGAVGQLRSAIELDPGDAQKRQNLAAILSETGHDAEAVAELRRALELEPANARLHWGLGDLLARQGETAAAIEHLRAALAAEPDLAPIRRALAYYLYQQGEREEAAAVLAGGPGAR